MFKGFLWKIWGFGFLLSVFIIVVTVSSVGYYYLQQAKQDLVQKNYRETEIVAHIIESSYLRRIWPFKTLNLLSKNKDILFLQVIKPQGEIFWADKPEVIGSVVKNKERLSAPDEPGIKTDFFRNEKIKTITYPLNLELGESPWHLYLGISLARIKTTTIKIVFFALSYLVGIGGLLFLASFYLSKKVTRPLQKLRKGAETIAKGDFEHRIKIATGGELEDLKDSFNQMAKELEESHDALKESEQVLKIKVKARTKELKEINQQLEARVKERTKDLQQQIDELERFHKLTVGREMKMIDLKKELKKAKQKIEELKGRKNS